jgi:hypothetical protein
MNMNFEELSNLINEGIGEDAAEKFKQTFAGDTAPEFISFRYKNEQGEIADRVVNIGLGYQQMLDKNDEKLNKAKLKIEELKTELRPILQKKAEATEGLFNNHPVDAIIDALPQIIKKAEDFVSQAMSRAAQEIEAVQGSGYEPVLDAKGNPVKGIRYYPPKGCFYIFAPEVSKKIVGDKVPYTTKSKSPVTAGEKFVRSYLKLLFPKNYKISKSKIKSFKARGNMIELEGDFDNCDE